MQPVFLSQLVVLFVSVVADGLEFVAEPAVAGELELVVALVVGPAVAAGRLLVAVLVVAEYTAVARVHL